MDRETRPNAMRETPDGNRISYKNPEGYADPTPYDALKRLERTNADINALRLIKCVLTLLDINGYVLIDRLHIRDRITGREYQ